MLCVYLCSGWSKVFKKIGIFFWGDFAWPEETCTSLCCPYSWSLLSPGKISACLAWPVGHRDFSGKGSCLGSLLYNKPSKSQISTIYGPNMTKIFAHTMGDPLEVPWKFHENPTCLRGLTGVPQLRGQDALSLCLSLVSLDKTVWIIMPFIGTGESWVHAIINYNIFTRFNEEHFGWSVNNCVAVFWTKWYSCFGALEVNKPLCHKLFYYQIFSPLIRSEWSRVSRPWSSSIGATWSLERRRGQLGSSRGWTPSLCTPTSHHLHSSS